MSTLTAPSKSAKTAQLLTENWLRNVFPTAAYTVCGYTGASDDPDADRTPRVVVEHARAQGGDEQAPVLLVEVSDAPVSDETAEDAGRHAAAGVRDYWVIEVSARRLHVYRDPRPDPDAKHGAVYKQVRAYSQNALVAPLAAEIHLAQVVNLLPW
jgi:Uma2 family endonuclease